jgi:hypothetical protein
VKRTPTVFCILYLWGELGSSIDPKKHIQASQVKPVVAILAGLIVKKIRRYHFYITKLLSY